MKHTKQIDPIETGFCERTGRVLRGLRKSLIVIWLCHLHHIKHPRPRAYTFAEPNENIAINVMLEDN